MLRSVGVMWGQACGRVPRSVQKNSRHSLIEQFCEGNVMCLFTVLFGASHHSMLLRDTVKYEGQALCPNRIFLLSGNTEKKIPNGCDSTYEINLL